MKNYTRLTQEERWHIAVHHSNGKSIGCISRLLNRHHATISRELQRNRTAQGYKAEQAHTIATNRHCYRNQQRRKIKGNVFSLIVEKIQQYWSPKQTSGWLRETHGFYISHETIYQRIWRDQAQRREIVQVFTPRRAKVPKARPAEICRARLYSRAH